RSGSRGPQLDLDLELDVGLELRKLPEIGHPVALTVSSSASATVTFGDPVSLTTAWTLDQGLSVALPAAIDLGGVVTITEIGLRRPEKGHLSLELGVAPSGTGDAAVGGLPNVVALDYDGKKVSVHVERKNQPVVLLVPDVLYAEGTLERGGDRFSLGGSTDWGPPLRGQLRAFLVGNGTAGTLAEQMQKTSYLFDLEVGLLSATSKTDGLQALVLTLDADFHPGLPLGTSGTSLYGIGLTYGQNAKPDTPNDQDPYGHWFLDQDPVYTTAAEKWTPARGHWGFGAGVSLGSQPDGGRSWNAAAGLILLLPGPAVLLTGKGNLFAPPPTLPKPGGAGGGDVSAPFAAILALDFDANRFTADLRAELDVKAGDRDLVKAHVPAEIGVELEHPSDFHVYLGQSAPPEKRISATALDLLDVSGYLMIGGKGLDLTPSVAGSRPLHLPGLAAAYGAAAGIDWSFSHPPFALKLWATLGYDLGASFALPPLLVGFVYAEGGLHATAFGVGAEVDAALHFAATAPDPFALDGVASVHLALPWPLPDLDAQAKLTFGTPKQGFDRLPDPPDVIGDAVAYDPLTGKRTPLAPHGARAADVPVVQVDTGLLLPFEAAVGNKDAKPGSITLDGVDTANPVWQVLTDDGRGETLGYRHVLTELSLTAHGGGAVEALATWPTGTAGGNAVSADATAAGNAAGSAAVPRTAGNQVARTHVQLLDVAGDEVLRRVGVGATLVEQRLSAWSPCALPDRATKATQDEKSRTRTAVAPGGPPSIGVHLPERPPPVAPPPGLRPHAADAVLGPTPVPLRETAAIDGATTWVSAEAPP
ncbi:MAG TPA: hypothetical protein VJ986_13060, partial [Gaiellaceae bacterium]|nr:hypothetical protein [Gaiellaceae bacterium]